MGQDQSSEPLFASIARDQLSYCAEVSPVERIMVRIDEAGNLLIKGRRADIETLVRLLRQQGLAIMPPRISFCG
ncbi:MAG: hypothetical protein WCJ55_05195 [Chloroflexales bacterium]